jgi:hypothetical protein
MDSVWKVWPGFAFLPVCVEAARARAHASSYDALPAREGDAPDRPPACEPHLGRLSVPVQPEPVCTTAGFAAPFSPFSSRRVANVDGPIACLLQDLWAERDKRASGTAGSKWPGPVEKRIRGLKIGPVGIRNTVGSLSRSLSKITSLEVEM